MFVRLNRKTAFYLLSVAALLILAAGTDIFAWKSLLTHHKITAPQSSSAVLLTASYYFFLFSLFTALAVFPKIKWFIAGLAGLHAAVFLCSYLYFFQYGAFITWEALELFLRSTGETFGFIRDSVSISQFFLFLKLLALSLLWIVLLCAVLFRSGGWPGGLSGKVNGSIAAVFFVTGIVFYSITGFILTRENLKELRMKGSLASHFYLAGKGMLEEKVSAGSGAGADVQLTYTDPAAVPRNNANIILIIMDSVRADHLPSYGYGRNTAPFLKSISGDMVKVNYCYAQANGTTKSFPSILLGRYPLMSRPIKDWGFAESVSKNGYSMAVSSSMDLNWAGIIKIFSHPAVKKVFHAGMVSEENRIWGFNLANKLNYGVDDGFSVEEVRKWIGNLPQPFFLIVHLHTAHYAYIVPQKYEVFKPVPKLPFRAAPPWAPMLNAYDNAIYRVDDAVRELFGIFRDNHLLDSSVIAITSDHGEAFDEHPGSYYHQTTVYDSQVRVPLFFYLGRNVSASRRFIVQGSGRVTGLIDVIPTLYKACGLGLPAEFEGVPVWGKSTKSFETMISFLVRKEFGIRKDRWKYIRSLKESRSLLFDIEKDPGEKKDLAKDCPGLVKEFDSLYRSVSSLDFSPGGLKKPVAGRTLKPKGLF